MIDQRARPFFNKYLIDPVARLLVWVGLSAPTVTVSGLLLVVSGAVILGLGHPVTGVILIGLGSLLDGIDGAVARLTGTASDRGAFLDTVSDRIGELAMFGGVAWFVAEDATLVLLTVITLGNSMLIPYIRSKAEAAGGEGKGGLMGRAERIILFCALAGPVGLDWWGMEAMLWPMVVLTGITVLRRSWKSWSQLSS
ncbi:MAG: CDP-alcohol phosphatidyltransferase family protein [Nitrospirales bacterium]